MCPIYVRPVDLSKEKKHASHKFNYYMHLGNVGQQFLQSTDISKTCFTSIVLRNEAM